ncbi:MAG: MlaD family protein, partial [Verrucomicrobiota bacterium]
MSQTTANISKDKRISAIWILPLLVLIIGGWVVFRSILNQGPEIEIEFATADGLKVDKTKIKVRNIDLGTVSEIRLSADYEKVIVKARLETEAIPLLTEDAVFWVVKPRVGATGISGVGTLLSGAYIELDPGVGE